MGIITQTKNGNNIENEQVSEEMTYGQLLERDDVRKKFLTAIVKGNSDSIYNCHGLTFASRRTGIYHPTEVEKFLDEDGYFLIELENVMPGDIILYLSPNGGHRAFWHCFKC